MPKLTNAVPKYRKHRASGQALVTIGGHDYHLGPHGTKASRFEYDRLFGEWLLRRPHQPSGTPNAWDDTVSYDRAIDLTVTEAQLDAEAEVPVQLPEGRTITVRLGRPMSDGCRLRLRGLGSEGKGDLYIRLHVSNKDES